MIELTRRRFAMLGGSTLMAQTLLGNRETFAQAAVNAGNVTNGTLAGRTLTEVSAGIHNRTVTPTELTKALLDRINIYNPKIDCYITIMGKEALRQAAKLDLEQKEGKFRSPLHGIPIALKDNIDTAGTRTTAASPMFRNRIPTEDADVVRRLKSAGAVILGKLNMQEFAIGCTGDVSYFGPTRNPWSLERVTGGSSAGPGAALAANLIYGALGTDTGGSIRIPAAWCGIVGLKPTVGLVSIRGIIPCTADLDHCGPMARTVEDVALMLGQMTGYDQLDIFSVPSTPEDYVKAMKQPVSSFRLCTPQSFYDHVEPEIEAAVNAALEVLTKLTVGVTSHAPLWEGPAGSGLGDREFYHHDLIEKYGMNYMPPTRARIERIENPPAGTKVATAADAARAHQQLETTRRMIDAAFTNFDLVVVPTTREVAPRIDVSLAAQMPGAGRMSSEVYDFFPPTGGCANTYPFDVYGIPAISLPCGFTKDGMPIGLMIAGPHFSEGKVLALAYAYQQATSWHTRRPSLTPDTVVPPIVEGETGAGAKS